MNPPHNTTLSDLSAASDVDSLDLPRYDSGSSFSSSPPKEHDRSTRPPSPITSGSAITRWLRTRGVWTLFLISGLAFLLLPLRLGMYGEAAEGQRMLERFTPVMTEQRLSALEDHLRVIEAARSETADRHLSSSDLAHINTVEFVAQFPTTHETFSHWISAMRADEAIFAELRSLPPFGLFPFVFALAGLVLLIVGSTGLFVQSRAATRLLSVIAGLVGALLIIFPIVTGVFEHSSAGSTLLRDFRPILTEDNVRWAQGQFVIIGPSSAELLGDVQTQGQAALPATHAFVSQWSSISADFASVIEEFADNLGHFHALERLNNTSASLGFTAFDAFGWFYLLPGAVIAVLAVAGLFLSFRSSPKESS